MQSSPLHSTVLETIRKNCLKIVKNPFFVKNGQFLAGVVVPARPPLQGVRDPDSNPGAGVGGGAGRG